MRWTVWVCGLYLSWKSLQSSHHLGVSHGVFHGGHSAVFKKSWSPQWEDIALKMVGENYKPVTDVNTHTPLEYSLQLQGKPCKPETIQYCLVLSQLAVLLKCNNKPKLRQMNFTTALWKNSVSVKKYACAIATATQNSVIIIRWIITSSTGIIILFCYKNIFLKIAIFCYTSHICVTNYIKNIQILMILRIYSNEKYD